MKDMCSGHGRMVYRSGAVYDGQWRKGKWNGVGRLEYTPTRIFEGQFCDGERKDGPGCISSMLYICTFLICH